MGGLEEGGKQRGCFRADVESLRFCPSRVEGREEGVKVGLQRAMNDVEKSGLHLQALDSQWNLDRGENYDQSSLEERNLSCLVR